MKGNYTYLPRALQAACKPQAIQALRSKLRRMRATSFAALLQTTFETPNLQRQTFDKG